MTLQDASDRYPVNRPQNSSPANPTESQYPVSPHQNNPPVNPQQSSSLNNPQQSSSLNNPQRSNYRNPQQISIPVSPLYHSYPVNSQANPKAEQSKFSFQQNTGADISEADFIKVNTQYYRAKFSKMRLEKKKACWNTAAFYFNVFWCLYRKMYKVGFIFAAIQLLGFLSIELQIIFNLGTAIVLGIMGNSFYMRYTEAAMIKAEGIPPLERYKYLRKKGGTSVWAVFCLISGSVFIGFIIGFFQEFVHTIYGG